MLDSVVVLSYAFLSMVAWRALRDFSRETAEHAIAQDELHLTATALEKVGCGIVITDPHSAGNPAIYCNQAFRSLTGYEESETLGKSCRFLQGPETCEEAASRIRAGIRAGIGCREVVKNYRKDGSVFWNELTIAPVKDDEGSLTHFVGIQTDVTVRKEAEEATALLGTELRRSQKMEALGVLAGGIAHDFNNLLGAIMGNADLALGKVTGDATLATNLQRILDASHRAKQLVSHMLSFSRQDEVEKSEIDIHSVVAEAAGLIRSSLPAMVRIRMDMDESAGIVVGNSSQIHRIVMNLCTNAHHAMGESGGVLGLSLHVVTLGPGRLPAADLAPGQYVKLSVSDTGCGMDDATLAKVFDPFFTTKPVDEGTGMGLSVVYGIVSNHGGAITVDSVVDEGTTFNVFLPRGHDGQRADGATTAAVDPVAPRGERVLLIDDEEVIVDTAREALEKLGYVVTALSSSVEALKVFRAEPNGFDVVVTDQAMPRINGIVLARIVSGIRPEIPIIVATGYSEIVTPDRAREMGFCGYVRKPYLGNDLDRAIRGALETTNPVEG